MGRALRASEAYGAVENAHGQFALVVQLAAAPVRTRTGRAWPMPACQAVAHHTLIWTFRRLRVCTGLDGNYAFRTAMRSATFEAIYRLSRSHPAARATMPPRWTLGASAAVIWRDMSLRAETASRGP